MGTSEVWRDVFKTRIEFEHVSDTAEAQKPMTPFTPCFMPWLIGAYKILNAVYDDTRNLGEKETSPDKKKNTFSGRMSASSRS